MNVAEVPDVRRRRPLEEREGVVRNVGVVRRTATVRANQDQGPAPVSHRREHLDDRPRRGIHDIGVDPRLESHGTVSGHESDGRRVLLDDDGRLSVENERARRRDAVSSREHETGIVVPDQDVDELHVVRPVESERGVRRDVVAAIHESETSHEVVGVLLRDGVLRNAAVRGRHGGVPHAHGGHEPVVVQTVLRTPGAHPDSHAAARAGI